MNYELVRCISPDVYRIPPCFQVMTNPNTISFVIYITNSTLPLPFP